MKTLLVLAALACSYTSFAQIPHPSVPKGKPGQVPLPTPKIQALKPDIIYVSSRVVSIVENTAMHRFETTISITLRNQGTGNVPTGFFLDLQSKFGTRQGGFDYSRIGVQCSIRGPMAPGEERTVEYVFIKDITAMGRAPLPCIIRLDWNDLIKESDENNNRSPEFIIDPPGM